MKKKIPFLVLFIMASVLVWKLEPKNITITEVQPTKAERNIASVKEVIVTKETPKKKITLKEKNALITTSLIKENEKIESKLLSYYNDLFENNVKVELKYEKEVEINEDKSSYKAKVYQVSFDKGKGNKSRFKAMIDSQTGMILKTWNHTRYEFKEPLHLSGEGRELYSL